MALNGNPLRVFVEVFVCAHQNGELVRYYRLKRDITLCPDDPDQAVKDLMEEIKVDTTRSICLSHSTSWRYEAEKSLILTYIVWVADKHIQQLPTRTLDPGKVRQPMSSGPMTPRPPELDETHALVHGLRHLSYLFHKRRDPNVLKALDDPGTMKFFQTLRPALAGRL